MFKYSSISVIAILLVLAFDQNSPSWPTSNMGSPQQCLFSEVYLDDGWKIPGVSGAVPKGPKLSLSGREGVFITELKAGTPNMPLTLLSCSRDTPGRLVLRPKTVRVLSLSRLDYNGKIFAYEAEFEPQISTNGELQRSLEFVRVIFYDMEGKGRFSILKYPKGGAFSNIDVPDWAKSE